MVFIPLLRIVALWFPPLRIPMVSQVTGLLGQIGALGAATPLVYALHRWGWTPSYAVCGPGRRPARCARPRRRARLPQPRPRARPDQGPRPGPQRPCRLAHARDPARAVVALLGTVRRHGLRAAVGLPVPRCGTGAFARDGRHPADADDRHHGRQQPADRGVRHQVPVLALDPDPRDRLLDHDRLGASSCSGRAGRRCRCWCCWSSSPRWAVRGRWSASTWPGPSTRPPGSAAPPGSSTSVASWPPCRP